MKEIDFHSIAPRVSPRLTTAGKEENAPSFDEIMKDAIGEVNRLQNNKHQAIRNMVETETPDIHNTMIDVQKADISFKLLMQVRNKVVSAYQEIMRMNV